MDGESQLPKDVAEQAAGETKATAVTEAGQKRDASLPEGMTETPKLTTNSESSDRMQRQYGWSGGMKPEDLPDLPDNLRSIAMRFDSTSRIAAANAMDKAKAGGKPFGEEEFQNALLGEAKKFLKKNPQEAESLSMHNNFIKSEILTQKDKREAAELTAVRKQLKQETIAQTGTPQPEGATPLTQSPVETPLTSPSPPEQTPAQGEKPPAVEDKPAASVIVEQPAAQPVEIDTTVGDAEAPAGEPGTAKEEAEMAASSAEPLSTDSSKEPEVPPDSDAAPGLTPDAGAPEQVEPAPKPPEPATPLEPLEATAAAGGDGETPPDDEEPEGDATGDEDTDAGATGEQNQTGEKKPETPEEKAAREAQEAEKERLEKEFIENLSDDEKKEYEKFKKERASLDEGIETVTDLELKKRMRASLKATDDMLFARMLEGSKTKEKDWGKHIIYGSMFGVAYPLFLLIKYLIEKSQKS